MLTGLAQLRTLRLDSCTIQFPVKFTACRNLVRLTLLRDAWIRQVVLESIGRLPWLLDFGFGHYEHSDSDCNLNGPKMDDSMLDLASQVIGVFSKPLMFPKLAFLTLEHNC